MEIDITSVVIGIASLATFAVPIGYDQFKVKRAKRKSEEQFLNSASETGFVHGSFEVLHNGAAIGICLNREELLYVKKSSAYTLIELCDVTSSSTYKSESVLTDNNGLKQNFKEMGIKLSTRHSGDIKIPVFEGRDGTQRGNESLIIERWMSKINKAVRDITQPVSSPA